MLWRVTVVMTLFYDNADFFQRSYQQCITAEFQQNYAHVVLELTQLNASLAHYLDSVHSYSQEVCASRITDWYPCLC